MVRRTARRPHRGFTLIELMIAVAVVAILAAVALPSYRSYIMRGNIPDATSQLSSRQVQMEQYFMDNRTYVGGPACAADTTTSRVFDFTCTNGGDTVTATAYRLTAVGKGTMTGFTYTINQAGVRTTAITSVPGWSISGTVNCWVTKAGGVC